MDDSIDIHDDRYVQEVTPIGRLLDLDTDIECADINNLKLYGFHTLEAVAYSTKTMLCEVSGISEEKANRLLKEAMRHCSVGFTNALEFLVKRNDMIQITTGSDALDMLLNGGIETGSITELIGSFRSGRTQFCHTIAVTCQLPLERGGGDGKCIYIDTEGSFRPERIVEIAKQYELECSSILKNIHVARCYNTDHQTQLLQEAAEKMSEDRYVAIIVDSATRLYTSDFNGNDKVPRCEEHLIRFLCMLQRIAEVYSVAVVVTNQLVDCSTIEGSCQQQKPFGGNLIAHTLATRLYLEERQRGKERICKLYSSPCLPESEARFAITNKGICDQ